MAEETNIIKFLCKYQVKTLVFMKDDEKIEMDASNVLSIEYLADYDQNIRAILKLNLRMDVRKKMWILKNKRDIICKFELCKIPMDMDVEKFKGTPATVWNDEFGIYFNDQDESIDTSLLAQRLQLNDVEHPDINDIETENYYESQNILEVFLFNQKLLNASMKTYNHILTKDTLQQLVARMLTETKHPKVLISKFENDEVYEELLVPALPLYKAIGYLDQYYGFYKKGAIIFYDVDVLYILNANGKMTAKRDDEWYRTTFLVTRIEGSTPGNGMVRREGEGIHYLSYPEQNVTPKRFSIINNAQLGSDTKLVITDDVDMDDLEADQSYIEQRNQTIIRQHKDDNKYSADQLNARMEEAETVLYLTGDNMDINAFCPNHEFNCVFDDQTKQDKYGVPKYRLAYCYHYIKLESEGFMSASHQVILKKRSEGDGGGEESVE